MKIRLHSWVWLAMPVVVAVGCSTNTRDASVSYSPALSQSVSPTSDRGQTRIYSDQDVTVGSSTTPVPAGASNQDWQLAEEIRALLSANPKLGNAPMAAVVNNGVVTLRGSVRNKTDRRRLIEQIAALPG